MKKHTLINIRRRSDPATVSNLASTSSRWTVSSARTADGMPADCLLAQVAQPPTTGWPRPLFAFQLHSRICVGDHKRIELLPAGKCSLAAIRQRHLGSHSCFCPSADGLSSELLSIEWHASSHSREGRAQLQQVQGLQEARAQLFPAGIWHRVRLLDCCRDSRRYSYSCVYTVLSDRHTDRRWTSLG